LPPVDVNIIKIEKKTIPAPMEFVGVTESSHMVEIRARVEGYLDKIDYEEGSYVTEGTLLFQLDPRQFVASLDSANAEQAKQEAILWNAQKIVGRLKPLYEQKAASQRDLDNAVAHELASEANLIAAKANVTQAELNLSYTTIRSPISGLTAQAKYREGALITTTMQNLLTTVSVVDPMWINFNVSENDLLKFRQQIKDKHLVFPKDYNFDVKVILANNKVFPQTGKVNFAEPSLNPNTGTMYVRATMANPDKVLKPAQFVRAKLLGAMRPNAIAVPQQAVQQGNKSAYVFIVKNNKAVMQNIVPGDWYGDNWIIESGLEVGDEVIVDGVNKVIEGQSVNAKVIPYDPTVEYPEKASS
jgi:membrane fusion protein (multidrug efflux system)